MKNFRILFISPSYYPATYWGGPIFALLGLNKALASFPNIEQKILTTDSAGLQLSDRVRLTPQTFDGILDPSSVIFTQRVYGRSTSIELLFRLPFLILWADCVFLAATYSFPTIPTFFLCNILNKPLAWCPFGAILDSQNLPFSSKKKLKRVWEGLINVLFKPKNMILMAASEEEKLVSLKRIPRAKGVILTHGIDVPKTFPQRTPARDQLLRLIFLSRLDPKKGLENLFEALSILQDRTIVLTVYGTGDPSYTATLIQKARQCELFEGQIKFAGHVDGEAKESAFQNADVFILPSHSESFGIAVEEALAWGLPVIVSKHAPWKGLETNRCGLWVENDPASLAQAIRRIRGMNLTEMGQEGWRWMQRDFSWPSVAKSMLDLYKNLIPGNNQLG